MLYINAHRIGSNIFERYVKHNGEEEIRKIAFKPTLFSHTVKETKYKDIYGKFCNPIVHDNMYDANKWMRNLQDMGMQALGQENFVLQYLSNTYREAPKVMKKLIRISNVDIEVTAPEFPNPDEAKYPIDAITHYDSIEDKLFVFDLLKSYQDEKPLDEWNPSIAVLKEADGGDEVDQEIIDRVEYMSFTDEKEMLLEYIAMWSTNTPAVLTGWNTETFDIPYIVNRIKNVLGEDHAKLLSPYRKVDTKVIKDPYGDKLSYSILGVESLDYMILYKKFSFTPQPTYALDYISEAETGRGKLPYDGPIHKLREENHQRYISYNIVDVWRVQEIDKVRGFIDLVLSIAYYARINYEDVLSPIKTWDAIIFNSLREVDIVLPEKKHHIKQKFQGAYVKEPNPGAYKYVVSTDATSLKCMGL